MKNSIINFNLESNILLIHKKLVIRTYRKIKKLNLLVLLNIGDITQTVIKYPTVFNNPRVLHLFSVFRIYFRKYRIQYFKVAIMYEKMKLKNNYIPSINALSIGLSKATIRPKKLTSMFKLENKIELINQAK